MHKGPKLRMSTGPRLGCYATAKMQHIHDEIRKYIRQMTWQTVTSKLARSNRANVASRHDNLSKRQRCPFDSHMAVDGPRYFNLNIRGRFFRKHCIRRGFS